MDKKIPVKTVRVTLDGEYAGWWFDVRTNPPVGVLLDRIAAFESADKENLQEFVPAIYGLLELMICGWNFKDERGKALALDTDGLRKISLDLLILMGGKVPDVITEAIDVPKA